MERTPRTRARMRSGCAQRAAYHRARVDSYASMAPKIAVVREGDGENGSCNDDRGRSAATSPTCTKRTRGEGPKRTMVVTMG